MLKGLGLLLSLFPFLTLNDGGNGGNGDGDGSGDGGDGGDKGAGSDAGDGGQGDQGRPSGGRKPVEEMDEDELRRTVRSMRSETKDERLRREATERDLTEAKKKLDEIEQEKLSDADKAKQAAANEKSAREKAEAAVLVERLKNRTYVMAVSKKVIDPEAVFAFLDQSKVIWKDDEPENLEGLVDGILERKKYLLDEGTGDGKTKPTTSTGQPTRTVPTEAKPGLERMRAAHASTQTKKGA